jgi:hypothetical protein
MFPFGDYMFFRVEFFYVQRLQNKQIYNDRTPDYKK